MAFNHPVEADRVEDFGFFSVFFRAPLIGTLLWLVGGNEALKQEQKLLEGGNGVGSSESTYNESTSRQSTPLGYTNDIRKGRRLRDMSKTMPHLVGSDLSEITSWANAEESQLDMQSSFSEDDVMARSKRTRRMSWSDEIGLDLVEYVDETRLNEVQQQSPSVKKPTIATNHPNATPKPMKSAMKRSRSVRKDATSLENGVDVSRCIPKGLSSGHGGLLIPTKPYGYDNGTRLTEAKPNGYVGPRLSEVQQKQSGYVSPEWGWYINTTPPTPEMYPSTKGKPVKKLSYNGSRPSTLTNPAFSKGGGKGAAGWPSIPL